MNRTTFLAFARKAPFGGRLTQAQIDGMNAVLDEWQRRGLRDRRWLANMLAQEFHETGGRMQPVRETFASSDAQAIARLEKASSDAKLKWVKKPYWRKNRRGLAFFGRGPIQITHESNYAKFGIADHPEKALDLETGVRIMFDGMLEGKFTGRRLPDYFNIATDGPVGARKIVNGTDKAKLIAGYHKNFLDALDAAAEAEPQPDVKPEDAKPDDVPAAKSKSLWTILVTLFPGLGGLAFLEKIDNPFALVAFSLVLVAVGAWLVFTGRVTINRGKATA
ncbi:hypothetical protein [Ensifer sp. LC163]|uniref:hypothetical protein n=1 Tax=Ensifer sp. LC163 TaxID=1120652 RepID=UPI00081358FF|nr:hypothetical protein [Ensifer sp. LC163]OCP37929.1 hypothetical protein BC360_19985 [Ensifer sp. LC163]